MEVRRFLSIVSGISLLAIATLSARAVSVTAVDGVNFSYTATDVNGTLTVTFDMTGMVTKINGSAIVPPFDATFATLTLSPTSGSNPFTPHANSTQYGITSLSGPVVFNYGISSGQASGNGLILNGSIGLAAGSGTTYTDGSTTYDFSAFANPGDFSLTLNGSVVGGPNGETVSDLLSLGNGTFEGSGSFSQAVPDSGTTVAFLGFSLLGLAFLRRKMTC